MKKSQEMTVFSGRQKLTFAMETKARKVTVDFKFDALYPLTATFLQQFSTNFVQTCIFSPLRPFTRSIEQLAKSFSKKLLFIYREFQVSAVISAYREKITSEIKEAKVLLNLMR